MKKYVLFDNDGVLVDTEPLYFRAGQLALAEIGIAVDREQYVRDMIHDGGTWGRARDAGVDEATIDRLRDIRDAHYRRLVQSEAIAIPGVVDALRELSRHVRMAIVTTSVRTNFELIHQDRRILSFMDFSLVREDYTRAKPDPEPYVAALERFDAVPDDALVVEDSERGLRSAIAAGIECAVVHNAFTASHDFSGATHRIQSLSELTQLVLA